MLKVNKIYLLTLIFLATNTYAVPLLQIGAPGGPGEGSYADYETNLLNPVETDTAVTSGSTLLVSGITEVNKLLSLGADTNWSQFNSNTENYSKFDGYGTVLIATIEESWFSGLLQVDGADPFLTDSTLSFPNNHDPIKDKNYMYFDIGSFATSGADYEPIPNFVDESIGSKSGEIKELSLTIDPSFAGWIHFDVLSIAEYEGTGKSIESTFQLENNPGSKDVTWQSPEPIPEPTAMLLYGAGLMGIGYLTRKKRERTSK